MPAFSLSTPAYGKTPYLTGMYIFGEKKEKGTKKKKRKRSRG
jgi:hypothetical protein